MPLSETNQYTRILVDLAWLNRNVKLDPNSFARDYLMKIADELTEIVEAVDAGIV